MGAAELYQSSCKQVRLDTMKSAVFAAVFITALLCVSSASAHKLVLNGTPKRIESKSDDVGFSMCPICNQLAATSINSLLNVILQGGIIGSCGALCGQLPEKWESVACNLVCDYVGVSEFIKAIDKADLDPIYMCELIDLCPVHDGGSGKILNITTNPPSGPSGTTFEFTMVFDIYNQTGTGVIEVGIIPPGSQFGSGEGFLNEGYEPGRYGVQIQLNTELSEEMQWSPGQYTVEFDLCYGECGFKHPHS